jgi:hypothetical protein
MCARNIEICKVLMMRSAALASASIQPRSRASYRLTVELLLWIL